MPHGRAKLLKKPHRKAKSAIVRKLSPEQPAARDEGPRLIPLGPGKDAGVGRIEHYLELADKALGHTPVKAPVPVLQGSEAAAQIPTGQPGAEVVEQAPPVPPHVPSPVASAYVFQPLYPPPKLQVPKPPSVPKPPKPPKLTRPLPPKAPAFPKSPRLSLPKPPRRKNPS